VRAGQGQGRAVTVHHEAPTDNGAVGIACAVTRTPLAGGEDQQLAPVRRVGRARAGPPEPPADPARRRLKALARRMGAISRPAAREAMTPSDRSRHHPVCPGGEPILSGGEDFVRVEGMAGRKVLRPWVTSRMRSLDQTADGSCTPWLLEECSHYLYASYRDEKEGQKHGGEDKKPTGHFIDARVSQHHGVTSRQRDGDK
jgi:hypothetical protein